MTFIKDKNGQWAHPGKNTLIPDAGGRITMKGVNQPVLGVDDLGNQTVMMPGGEYQFPGNDVYEMPLPIGAYGGQLPKFQIDGEKIKKTGKVINTGINIIKDTKQIGFGPSLIKNLPEWMTKPFTPTPLLPMKTRYHGDIGFDLKSIANVPQIKDYDDWASYVQAYNQFHTPIHGSNQPMIQSLLGDNSLQKNTDKLGNVNIGTMQSYINKTEKPVDKSIMQTALDDLTSHNSSLLPGSIDADGNIIKNPKVSLELFKQKVGEGIYKYQPLYTDKYNDYGINRLGYTNPEKGMITTAGGYQIEPSMPNNDFKFGHIIQNKSVLWTIPELGSELGQTHWGNNPLVQTTIGGQQSRLDAPVYGHTRYFIDDRRSKTGVIIEAQSDEFQKSQNKLIEIENNRRGEFTNRRVEADKELAAWNELDFEKFKYQALYRSDGGVGYKAELDAPVVKKLLFEYMNELRRGTSGTAEYGNEYNLQHLFDLMNQQAPTSTTKHYENTVQQAHQVYKEMQLADVDVNGNPGKYLELDDFLAGAYQYSDVQIKAKAAKAANDFTEGNIKIDAAIQNINKSFDITTPQGIQRKALNKNYQIRQLQETIKLFADNKLTTVRYPTAQTTALIQGYTAKDNLTTGLEKLLENPWTHVEVASFDGKINSLWTANTQVGGRHPAKVAKKYGPFVVIPDDHNMIYSVDKPGSGVPNFKSTAIGKEGPRDAQHQYTSNLPLESLETSETWRGIFLKGDENRYIGSNNLTTKGNVHYENANRLELREESYQVAGDFDGTQTGGVNRKSKWDISNTQVDIPADVRDNLQAGMYYIDETGKWNFVDDGSNTEKIKTYTREIRQKNHKVIDQGGDFDVSQYRKEHQTILNKYHLETPKMLNKTVGKDQWNIVYDEYGNSWYEFNIPKEYQIGEGTIKSFSRGGEIKQQNGGLRKFGDGGGVDYSDTEEVQFNGKTYHKYKVKKGDTKSGISQKYGLWNQEGIINSVNSKYSDLEDQPNYAKNINRMWADDYILVGGPEFESHTKYSQDRNAYANSFKNMSEEQLLSTITAIGHIETGNQVKYTKPEGRVYVTGKDLDEFGNSIQGGLYDQDHNPWTGIYESGIDKAYGHVSGANALGRFGIKETHLNDFAKDVLGYKEGADWKTQYLKNKEDQKKLMKYLITDIYPDELVQLRHSYPKATKQYSDFELIAALHREGQPRLRKHLAKGSFSTDPVEGDISVGGYVNKISGYLNPKLDNTDHPFYTQGQPLHKTFDNIPTYRFGGSIGKVKDNTRDEVIGDMLENGAFLPKFKTGSEKNINGILGNYNIKKGYDEGNRLPYIEYKSASENLENNKIYYDKDSKDDEFNIIDIYQQKYEQDRAHSRIKMIIEKYDNGQKLTPTETQEMTRLGLLDDTPKKEVREKEKVAEMKYGGASLSLDNIDTRKDLFNKTDGNNYGISLAAQIELYDAQVNGLFDKDNKFNKIKSIYKRLNTIYYNDSKASKLTVFDYMKSLNN